MLPYTFSAASTASLDWTIHPLTRATTNVYDQITPERNNISD